VSLCTHIYLKRVLIHTRCIVMGWERGLLKASACRSQTISHPRTANNKNSTPHIIMIQVAFGRHPLYRNVRTKFCHISTSMATISMSPSSRQLFCQSSCATYVKMIVGWVKQNDNHRQMRQISCQKRCGSKTTTRRRRLQFVCNAVIGNDSQTKSVKETLGSSSSCR